MSRQVLPIVGAIVGGIIGYYSGGMTGANVVQGAQMGYIAGSIVGPMVDPIIIQGNRVGDNQFQVAAEGGARAILFGRGCINSTCVIARGNRQLTKKNEGGGKGGGPKTSNEYVSWTFAIGLGEAMPGATILRVWQDENLVYDIREGGQRTSQDNSDFAGKFRFYDGSETQLPDPDLQTFLGVETPYFRGTAYIVFPNFDLTSTAERVPLFKFEISASQTNILPSAIVAQLLARAGMAPAEYDVTELNDAPSGSASSAVVVADENWDSLDSYVTVNGNRGLYSVSGNVLTIAPQQSAAWAQITKTLPAHVTFEKLSLKIMAYELNPDDSPIITFSDNGVIRLKLWLVRETVLDPARRSTLWVNGYAQILGTGPVLADRWYRFEYEINSTNTAWTASLIRDDDDFVHWTYTRTSVGAYPFNQIELYVDSGNRTCGIRMQPVEFKNVQTVAVAGVVIQETMLGADAVSAVVSPYFADPAEYDGKLHFIKRGKNALRVLTIDDLVEEPEVTSRENAVEYPAKLHLFYQSPKTGYAMTKATSTRYSPNTNVVGEASVTVPITFQDPDEPAGIVSKLHKVMWNEAGGDFSWTVGDHCIDLVPTDVVGLSLRGVVTRVRITAVDVQQGRIKLTMRKDRQSSYTADVTAIPLPDPTAPPVTSVSLAALAVMDIPALLDSDDGLYYYTAMSGQNQGWRGGQVQQSLDSGSTWAAISDSTIDVPMGRLTAAMAAASQHYPDNTNTVQFRLFDSRNQLDSLTDAQWLSEEGALAVQAADGSWELMQYRDALDAGGGVYTLSMLQRGRLNTAAVAHAVDALVVILTASVQRQAGQSAWLATSLYHRAVSYGTTTELAQQVITPFIGKSQKEWPVASFLATYGGGSILVSEIVPRHRFGTEDIPVRSTNWTGYRVVCLNGAGASVSVDTVNSSVSVDVTALGAVSEVRVAQVNRITGVGDYLSMPVTGGAGGGGGDMTPYEATVQLNGTFTTGIDVIFVAGAEIIGHHVIVGGDTNLDGVAAALAVDINTNTSTTGFTALAVGKIVELTGPIGYDFDLTVTFSGSSLMSSTFVQSAQFAGAGSAYSANYTVINTVTGVSEPIPAGTTFTLSFQKPIYNGIGSVSFTTTLAASTRANVYAGLAAQPEISPGGALYALGYRLSTFSVYGSSLVGTIVGPLGEEGLHVSPSATGAFGMTVAVTNPGSAASSGSVQIVKYTVSGTPVVGEKFSIVVGGTPFTFTAATASANDVAAGLAALVDAHGSYAASASGAEVTVSGVSNGQTFTYTFNVERAVTALVMFQATGGYTGRISRGFSPMIFATAGGKLYASTNNYLGPKGQTGNYRASRFWESPDVDGPFVLKRTVIALTGNPIAIPAPSFGRNGQTSTYYLENTGAGGEFTRVPFDLASDPVRVTNDLPGGVEPMAVCSDSTRIVFLATDGNVYSSTDGETCTNLGAFTGTFPNSLAEGNHTLHKFGSRWFMLCANYGMGEVNSNIVFYNDAANATGAWTAATTQPAFTRAPTLNVHEQMADDGSGLFLFINAISYGQVWPYKSTDNGTTWASVGVPAIPIGLTSVSVDDRGSPVVLRIHGADVSAKKNANSSTWFAAAANGCTNMQYAVVLGGATVVSDHIGSSGDYAEQIIKRDVAGAFTETIPGF